MNIKNKITRTGFLKSIGKRVEATKPTFSSYLVASLLLSMGVAQAKDLETCNTGASNPSVCYGSSLVPLREFNWKSPRDKITRPVIGNEPVVELKFVYNENSGEPQGLQTPVEWSKYPSYVISSNNGKLPSSTERFFVFDAHDRPISILIPPFSNEFSEVTSNKRGRFTVDFGSVDNPRRFDLNLEKAKTKFADFAFNADLYIIHDATKDNQTDANRPIFNASFADNFIGNILFQAGPKARANFKFLQDANLIGNLDVKSELMTMTFFGDGDKKINKIVGYIKATDGGQINAEFLGDAQINSGGVITDGARAININVQKALLLYNYVSVKNAMQGDNIRRPSSIVAGGKFDYATPSSTKLCFYRCR